MRENTCRVCDGSTVDVFGFKCKKCNDFGIMSIDRENIVCPYCGHDHIEKQYEIENDDNGFLSCDYCKKKFKIEIKYMALVSTFDLKKKKKS